MLSGQAIEKGTTMTDGGDDTSTPAADENAESTAAKADSVEATAAVPAEQGEPDAPVEPKPGERRLSFSFGFRSLAIAVAIIVLVAAVGILGWLYVSAKKEIDAQRRASDNHAHAEKVALDYAVNAAALNYQDLNTWKNKLVAGTSPELTGKLSDAAKSMEQILSPLQWTSTAQPLAAKVRSTNGGTYVVDSFVSVQTKTVQAPQPLQSTATYSVTIDSNNNWQITDVGGVGAVVGQK